MMDGKTATTTEAVSTGGEEEAEAAINFSIFCIDFIVNSLSIIREMVVP